MKKGSSSKAVYRGDYLPYPWNLSHVDLRFEIDRDSTRVISRMEREYGHRVELVEGYRSAERQQALFAQRVGWPDQWLASADAVPAAEQPYFSLLLIRQSWPAVLP